MHRDEVFVFSDLVGEVGGAAKATRLLCEALVRVGATTTLFVIGVPDSKTRTDLERRGIEVVTPLSNKGWRLHVPTELLVRQINRATRLRRPSCIIAVGLTSETRRLLEHCPAAPVWLWETTEALPHAKFLDLRISPLLPRAAGILVPSRTVGANAAKTYGYGGAERLLPFWVEPPRNRPSEPVRSRRLLFLGRLDMDKGLQHLFVAFDDVRSTFDDARLVVCGGGDVERVRKAAEGHEGIEVRGYVSAQELEEAIASCEALVLPSLHEGYPLTLLEACARGRPVIASEVGSIPEVYGGRECALLVRPGQPGPLAAAIIRLLSDSDELKKRRSDDALDLFERLCSPSAIDRSIEGIIRASSPMPATAPGGPPNDTFEMRYLRACPACGATGFVPFGYSISEGAPHCAQSRCLDCDVVFSNPQCTPKSLAQYYGDSYWETHWAEHISLDSDTARADLDSQRAEAGRIHAAQPGGGRLLEIGSGSGALLAALRERGFDVYGIEPSKAAAERSRACYGLEHIAVGTLETPASEGGLAEDLGAFDVIVAWHVIEHVTDLNAFLSQIRARLKPGGLLWIGTENYRNAGYGAAWLGQFLRGRPPPFATSGDHTFAFTSETLAAALRRGGFEVAGVESYQDPWAEKRKLMRFRNPLGFAWFLAQHSVNSSLRTGPFLRAYARHPRER